jgi:hypothetical protein
MKLVSTLWCFLLIARVHAHNVGDPVELLVFSEELRQSTTARTKGT